MEGEVGLANQVFKNKAIGIESLKSKRKRKWDKIRVLMEAVTGQVWKIVFVNFVIPQDNSNVLKLRISIMVL